MSKPTLNQIRDEMWHRGRLSFLWHAGQKVMNETWSKSVGQLFVMNVARQYGKSYYTVSKAVEQAFKQPKSRIKYGTAFHTDLTEFILPTFEKILETCPKSIRPSYKTQGSKWVFPNGSEIKLVGLDKSPNSLRGNTIDLIIIDEAGFVGNLDYVYKSVIVPATLHRPNCKIVFVSTPPSTPAHPFLDFAQRAESEGSYVKLDIYSNPLITQADIERMAKELGGYDSTSFKRECLCQFVTDTDSAIIPEWDDKFVQEVNKTEFYPYYHKYVGMDLGVKDFTAVIFGYYDFKKATLFIEEELVLNGPTLTTNKLKDAIKETEKAIWADQKPYRRISDNNNLMLIQDLSTLHDLSFAPTNKDTLEAMINEVRLMVQSGRIIINPKCRLTAGSLKYGVWDTKRTGFARSTTYGHFDCLAALIYLVRNLDVVSNPVPLSYNTNIFTHYTPPSEDNNNDKFKKIFNL